MARKRIKLNAICSSNDYYKSKRIHINYIKETHSNNTVKIQHIMSTAKIVHKYYVQCFDTLIEISEEDYVKRKESLKIIIK